VVSTKMAVFWVVVPCSLVEVGKLVPDYMALQPTEDSHLC
jgi:hypothetical protein